MMDVMGFLSTYSDGILFGLLIIFLTIFILYERKKGKVEVEKILGNFIYIVMYKTTWGLDQMDRWAKRHKGFFKYLNPVIIFTGIVGAVLISGTMIYFFLNMFMTEAEVQAVALVLPVNIDSAFVYYVPFLYWIISIFLIASVHEMAHGIIARYYNIKLKSTGFAFLGLIVPIIPAAFVQPDEKDIMKRPAKEQLAVYAAGPFSNFVFGLLTALLLIFILTPAINNLHEVEGIRVSGIHEQSDLLNTQFNATNELIIGIDNQDITQEFNMRDYFLSKDPGDSILLRTNVTEHTVNLIPHVDGSNRAYLGVEFSGQIKVKESKEAWAPFIPSLIWIHGLVYMLTLLNFGIGLFNLFPILITDGGRMLYTILKDYFKLGEERAGFLTGKIGLFFLIILLGLLFLPMTPIPEIIRGFFI